MQKLTEVESSYMQMKSGKITGYAQLLMMLCSNETAANHKQEKNQRALSIKEFLSCALFIQLPKNYGSYATHKEFQFTKVENRNQDFNVILETCKFTKSHVATSIGAYMAVA